MNMRLDGRKALITGSTAGIGLAMAKKLQDLGADIVINGRSEARVAETTRQLSSRGPGPVQGVAADTSDATACERIFTLVPHVDILINNVGTYNINSFQDISDEEWLRIFQTNVLSGIRMARFYFPKMAAKGWGRILFISSEAAIMVPGDMIHYSMTKAAQLSISRGLAELTRDTGVTVNTILPGPTRTEGVENFLEILAKNEGIKPEEAEIHFFKKFRPTSLLGRLIDPVEIANLAAFYVSPLASATNGAAIRVEGGLVRTIY